MPLDSKVTTEWPREGVALITVTDNTVPGFNFITWASVDALAKALKDAREKGARVIVLASGVEGHWLGHANLGDLRDLMAGVGIDDPDRKLTSTGWFECQRELEETGMVAIAAVTGDTSGGGCELGWCCSLRIAEEGVQFSQPEIYMGFPPGIGGASRLRRLIGYNATAEVIMMGRPISPERLYQLGAVNQVVKKGEAIKTALEWADHLANMPHQALAACKLQLVQGFDLSMNEAIANDQKIAAELFKSPDGMTLMPKIQARYESGESIRSVYWGPNPPRLDK